MAFRRDMLYEAIKVTMQAHGILSASYRFQVVRTDRRGHQYAVLLDLSSDFMQQREGSPGQWLALGKAIGSNAAARYAILVTGVYWRVNEEIDGFEASRPQALHSGGGSTPQGLASPRRKRGRAMPDELAAFAAATHTGQELRLRDRIDASDLAPLGGEMTGRDSSSC